MSLNDNPNLAIPANKTLKTPLKASVVLLSAFILASCGSSGSQSYNLGDVFGDSTLPGGGGGGDTDGGNTDGGNTDGGDTDGGNTGGNTGGSGNEPEANKSGVQTLNVNVVPLEKTFKTTTRDFDADEDSIVARADLASETEPGAKDGLLGPLTITTSGDGDTEVAGTNGFKAHEDEAIVGALGQELPLTYTSTYKDFGDDMRIGHIDGKALLGEMELPVSGAAVVGHATKAENMPNEGKVGYTGDATYRKLGLDNNIEFGSSVFTADFVAKNLSGKLSFENVDDINLTASIKGNQFSGKADANNGYATEGGFYGGDAQYLGGVYEGNGAQGTYGAVSDDYVEGGDTGGGDTGGGDTGGGDTGGGDTGGGDTGGGDTGGGDTGGDNQPEVNKSGVQSINVGTSAVEMLPLPDFKITTRDFEAGDNNVIARADLASGGKLLPAVDIQTSGENDTDLGSGYKSHENNTSIPTSFGKLPLEYTSVYKDYGDDMRIGHINGAAVLGTSEIPVDGAAVVGNATKAENMPNEGKVGYTGDATYRKLGIGNNIEFGESVFTADFVAKNLSGKLSFENVDDINLTASIKGNQFSGKADANNGYATEGGFYGGDAQYLGGVYEGNGAQGTYGAVSDDYVEGGDTGGGDTGGGDTGGGDTGGGDTGGGDTGGGDTGGGDTGGGDTGGGDTGGGTDPIEPPNPDAAPDGTISVIQSSMVGGKDSGISKNSSETYDSLTLNANEAGASVLPAPLKVKLRDASDIDYQDGFKRTKGFTTQKTEPNKLVSNKVNYTSVYHNFDDQMQIGHIYGDVKGPVNVARRALLSSTYVKGNATNLSDMKYLEGLGQYNIDKKINDGSVKYEGVASYMMNTKEEIIDKGALHTGTSEFDVNFVNKKVDGTLTFEDIGKKVIQADIEGNKFAGKTNDLTTSGGFYGEDANLLGGVYQDTKGKGTYGAEKVVPPAPVDPTDPVDPTEPTEPVNPPVPADKEMTGFQSSAFSSLKANSSTYKEFEDAIGYVAIRDDASDFTKTEKITSADGVESEVPIDNRKGNNFTAFDKGVVRGDMVQPASVKKPIEVNLQASSGTVTVDAGLGLLGLNPDFEYKAVYENFDKQMQVGHVYGVITSSVVGDASRVANVYVQGHLTAQEDIDYLKQVNDGKASYAGKATYIENIHLGDSGSFKPVEGTSSFDVDFVNNSVKGELAFDGDFKYMPEGNKIGIEATIDGNTFAGNVNGIDTAGGFYGEDAQFLGGIYQDASVEGGKGKGPGTGTKFQGTFGAEKQPAK